MRLIVADRSSGGVLAALLAVMVFLQLLVGGVAAGAGTMPSAAICTASDTGSEGDHRDHRPDCPCGLLCQASLQLLAAIDGPAAGTAQPIRFALAIERPRRLPPAPSRGDVGLHRDAQGPPRNSL